MAIDYGLKVVRAGFDVATAGVLDQEFNTSLNTMKTSVRGLATSTASGERSVLVSTLAYRCGFMMWFEIASSNTWYPNGCSISGEYACAYIDNSSRFYVDIYTGSSKLVTVKYVLLVDPGE